MGFLTNRPIHHTEKIIEIKLQYVLSCSLDVMFMRNYDTFVLKLSAKYEVATD
jgi:hypothetical protein